MRLRDKRCLIVGGTSGIGLASARRFVEEGARVVVAGLDESFDVFPFVRCDATVSEEVETLGRKALEMLGGLDVLFHVAGASGRRHGDGPLHECSDEGFDRVLDINLKSTFLTNRLALRRFLEQGKGGAILNTSSVLALSPSPSWFDTAGYVAAKGGVIAMSRHAAARHAVDGIRVNVLAPGLIDTPMSARAVRDEAIQQYLRMKQPLASGPGSPEDCADAAVFLCGDEARLITGVVLTVDGGWCVSEPG